MIAFSGLRPAVVLSQVVLTFGAAQLAGVAAAVNYQQSQVKAAQGAIAAADRTFAADAARILAEGTPHDSVDPVVSREHKLQAEALPSGGFIIDRLRIDGLNQRAAETRSLDKQLGAAETQVEVQMHQQLTEALKGLRDQVAAAQAAGVDPADYTAFADSTEQANQQLTTPKATQATIDAVNAHTGALKQATDAKIAADLAAQAAAEALQAAKDGASAALQSAQAALARAQAIPVLQVAANAQAISDLGQQLQQKLAANAGIDDFLSLGASLRDQAASLNNLVNTRQATYSLLAAARQEAQLAANAKVDMTADMAQLDALAPQLDKAGDLATLLAIKGQIQAVKNDVEAKYFGAIYGVGKVIVVSVTEERLVALQDGVIVLNTLVTTGRPSMPTILGTYHVFAKYSPYCMSSWAGNPYPWQGCAKMSYAMEWESSGYFIHDAPWRSVYGPGTDTEANGTHGCVNVPLTPMSQLYNWTDIGTTVVTKQGALPGD